MLSNKPNYDLTFELPREVKWLLGAVIIITVFGLAILSGNTLGAIQTVF